MSRDARVQRPEPLYKRALEQRIAERRSYLRADYEAHNRGALSRALLWHLLERCQAGVSFVTLHTWSREMQGRAYLWAIDYLDGRENNPQPWRL